MALIQVNLKPGKKDLTVFSVGGCLILSVVGLVLRLRGHDTAGHILWGLAVILITSRLISLKATLWLYRVFVVATLPIGWAISMTIMFLFYYGLLTPVGLVFRIMKRDSLHRSWDAQANSYWTPHTAPSKKERYFQQF